MANWFKGTRILKKKVKALSRGYDGYHCDSLILKKIILTLSNPKDLEILLNIFFLILTNLSYRTRLEDYFFFYKMLKEIFP